MAIDEFVAETAEDLSFVPGDVIELVERIDESWLKGYLGGQVGIFPQAFVRIERDFPSTKPSHTTGTGRECGVFSVAMVIVTVVIQVAMVTLLYHVAMVMLLWQHIVVMVMCCYGDVLPW